MTYDVFNGTLNLAQLINQSGSQIKKNCVRIIVSHKTRNKNT